MKKLILGAMLITGMMVAAQQDKPAKVSSENKKGRVEPLKPEQRAELQLKKMTLDLGLNEKQQAEIKKILSAQTQEREAKWSEMKAKKEKNEKLTNDERFALQSEILDQKIKTKEAFKKILTAEQFAKWEASEPKKRRMNSKKQ